MGIYQLYTHRLGSLHIVRSSILIPFRLKCRKHGLKEQKCEIIIEKNEYKVKAAFLLNEKWFIEISSIVVAVIAAATVVDVVVI